MRYTTFNYCLNYLESSIFILPEAIKLYSIQFALQEGLLYT